MILPPDDFEMNNLNQRKPKKMVSEKLLNQLITKMLDHKKIFSAVLCKNSQKLFWLNLQVVSSFLK
jgi:hypothetical protein